MPGLFGGVGVGPTVLEDLEDEFRATWGDCVVEETASGAVGAHAFEPHRACLRGSDGRVIALDGEGSLYEGFDPAAAGGPPFRIRDDTLVLESPAVGNLVVLDEDGVFMASDWTGTFPLYYAEIGRGLAWSSRLRPLAGVLDAERDDVGIMEFLTDGFTVGPRTPFRGVRRLLGGQALRFRPGQGVRITEHSRAWAGIEETYRDLGRVAGVARGALVDVLDGLPAGGGPAALMMSAGWDSRTLLAAAVGPGLPRELVCYGHGDPGSRELRLARRLCTSHGVPWQVQRLDHDLYDMDALEVGFARTESVVFPHWHRAGRLLSDQGVGVVYAGVYGEMLGGRYWLAHASSGVKKALTLFPALLRRKPASEPAPAEARSRVERLFRRDRPASPWFLDTEAVDAYGPSALEGRNGDVEEALDRYVARGVRTANQLAEAFQGEHIGSRYCNVQLLSCRARTDVAFPLADRRLLSVVTRTPIHTRMQNQLNRAIIGAWEPDLLRLPMAATLIPARHPIVLQEASRVVRKGVQGAHWRLHFASGGKVAAPRLSWPNYEFLRSGPALDRVLDQLTCDLWDRPALESRIEAVRSGAWRHELLPFSTDIAKMLTLDFLLR